MGSFQMFLILTAAWCGGVLTKEPDINTETIALEQYGVVLKPGKLMSNADVTHVQQGFRITIPKEKTYNKANYNQPVSSLSGPDYLKLTGHVIK